jgi:hypothetical protein
MALISRPPDQVIAAFIIGSCTLVATYIKIRVDMRMAGAAAQATRVRTRAARRNLIRQRAILAVMASAGILLLVHGALGLRATVPLPGATSLAASPVALAVARLTGSDPQAAGPAAESGLDSWLRVQGLTIYYRTSDYLPGACPGSPDARGNWGDGAPSVTQVRCHGEWLVFDVAPLLESHRVIRHLTYCVNFTDGDGVWGRHATLDPPGFADIAVPSLRIPLGRAIGFRIARDEPADRVLLTNAFPRASC